MDETVLLVDDDEGMRELMTDILEGEGYQVTACGAPLAALDLAASVGRVDLLVTDVVMPGMSGRQLARELVRRAPGLRVLYVSGYVGEVPGPREGNGRGERFLRKPFTRTELLEAVAEALRD